MLGRLRVPIPSSVKLENNQATLTSQDTKVDAKAIYTLETVSLRREEEEEKEEEGEEKKRGKHSGTKGTRVCVPLSSETSLPLSCPPSTSLNSSATRKT